MIEKNDVKNYAIAAAKRIDDKKCRAIRVIDLEGVSPLADYFILATVSSAPQAHAVIDEISRYFKDEGRALITPVGQTDGQQWMLLDYGFIVVHLFTKEGREYYDLDRLWHDAKVIFEADNE